MQKLQLIVILSSWLNSHYQSVQGPSLIWLIEFLFIPFWPYSYSHSLLFTDKHFNSVVYLFICMCPYKIHIIFCTYILLWYINGTVYSFMWIIVNEFFPIQCCDGSYFSLKMHLLLYIFQEIYILIMSIVIDNCFCHLGILRRTSFILWMSYFSTLLHSIHSLFFNNKCLDYKDAIFSRLFESINDFFFSFFSVIFIVSFVFIFKKNFVPFL